MNTNLNDSSVVTSTPEDMKQAEENFPAPCTVPLSTVLANPTNPQYRTLWDDFLTKYAATSEGKEIIEAIKIKMGIDIIK